MGTVEPSESLPEHPGLPRFAIGVIRTALEIPCLL